MPDETNITATNRTDKDAYDSENANDNIHKSRYQQRQLQYRPNTQKKPSFESLRLQTEDAPSARSTSTSAILEQYRRERLLRNTASSNMNINSVDAKINANGDVSTENTRNMSSLKTTTANNNDRESPRFQKRQVKTMMLVDHADPDKYTKPNNENNKDKSTQLMKNIQKRSSPTQGQLHQRLVQRNLLAIKSNLDKFTFPSDKDLDNFLQMKRQHGDVDVECSTRNPEHPKSILPIPIEDSVPNEDIKQNHHLRMTPREETDYAIIHANDNTEWLMGHLWKVSDFSNGIIAGLCCMSFVESLLPRTSEEFVVEVSRLAQESRRLFYVTTSVSVGVYVILFSLRNKEMKQSANTKDMRANYWIRSNNPRSPFIGLLGILYLLALILSLSCEIIGREIFVIQQYPRGQYSQEMVVLSNTTTFSLSIEGLQATKTTLIRTWNTLNILRSIIGIVAWVGFCFISHE